MKYIITENQHKILRRATEIESGIDIILNKIINNPDYSDITFDHVISIIRDVIALDVAEKSNLRGEDYTTFRDKIKVFIHNNYYDYIKSRWENQ